MNVLDSAEIGLEKMQALKMLKPQQLPCATKQVFQYQSNRHKGLSAGVLCGKEEVKSVGCRSDSCLAKAFSTTCSPLREHLVCALGCANKLSPHLRI